MAGNLPVKFLFQLRWPRGKSVCFWSCRLGFDSESGQTNGLKSGIHSFPARPSALNGLSDSVENKPASLLVLPLGKALGGIPPSWCGRPATLERVRYSALIAFS